MSHLPLPIIGFFLFTTLLALLGFGKAVRSPAAIIGTILWMCAQSVVALSGFYLIANALPPRFLLAVAPPLVVIAGLFLTGRGRRFLDGTDLKWCILLQSVRVLVELNLYWLFLYKQVPAQMTFEAGNLDILVGLTAPLIWWAFDAGRVGRSGLLIWNSLGVLSLLNAVARAMLSAPFRFQQFAFDQPTIAILYFPFVLLPAFIVPAALLCHLVVFRASSRRPRGSSHP
jgi:4-amino-4-deoxy-L-arabinose transferase-like glycosyltransferase